MLIYTKEDNGEAATMRVGDKLSIALAENAGTGYAWRITKSPAKSVLTKSVDGHVEPTPEPTGPPMAGRPGEHRWVFDAVGRGTTSIVLGLFPPGGGEASETFSVPVKVSG
jgi:predicted secreted protein